MTIILTILIIILLLVVFLNKKETFYDEPEYEADDIHGPARNASAREFSEQQNIYSR